MNRQAHNVRSPGFTLLEVLVAIGIFSLVAIISYSTLDTFIAQRERLTIHYGKLERIQRLFILLERDIQFIAARSVRNGGDREPAIVSDQGDALITMTVAQADVQSATGVSLKRVQWRLDGDLLIRAEWEVLDQNGNLEPVELLVSEDISEIAFNYYLYSPNQGVDEKNSLSQDDFPSGVEVNVTLKTGEKYRRVSSVAQAG
jgi:general secretion pathway protein J